MTSDRVMPGIADDIGFALGWVSSLLSTGRVLAESAEYYCF